MYENIGNKIKTLAQILGWLVLIAGIITWIVMLADGWGGISFIALAAGLVCFASSWFVYGFGQLVEDAHDLSNDVRALRNQSNEPIAVVEDDELPEL